MSLKFLLLLNTLCWSTMFINNPKHSLLISEQQAPLGCLVHELLLWCQRAVSSNRGQKIGKKWKKWGRKNKNKI
ncbi:hypothetical protein DFJ73DRAFT_836768, partial [Zopfochytrium polystomum]